MVGVGKSMSRRAIPLSPPRSVIGGTFSSIPVPVGKKSSTLEPRTNNLYEDFR